MRKLILSIPEEFYEKYLDNKVATNYKRVFFLGLFVWFVQVSVIIMYLINPFSDNPRVMTIYFVVYGVFIVLNTILLILSYRFKNEENILKSKGSMVLILHVATIYTWSTAVAIADQYQNEDIIVHYMIMMLVAILVEFSVYEFFGLLSVNYIVFVIISYSSNITYDHGDVYVSALQFIFFALVIRYFIGELTKKNFVQNAELEKLNSKLEFLSYYDGLSKLYNRGHWEDLYYSQYEKAISYQLPLSVIILDIDYFKQYNDTYGHVEGDEIIRKISKVLLESFEDLKADVGRYGGDEFIIVSKELNERELIKRVQLIKDKVKALHIVHESSLSDGSICVSVGYNYAIPLDEGGAWKFVVKADQHLYREKAARAIKQ